MASPGAGRWADWIRRYFGTKAGESVNVLTDVMPVSNLLEEAPELRFLRSERLFSSVPVTIAAVAGQYGLTQWAWTGGDHLCVITSIMAYVSANANVRIYNEASISAGTARRINYHDSRFPSLAWASSPLTCFTSTGAGVGANETDERLFIANQWQEILTVPVIIALNQGSVIVECQTANTTLASRVRGYLVPLHGSEQA